MFFMSQVMRLNELAKKHRNEANYSRNWIVPPDHQKTLRKGGFALLVMQTSQLTNKK